MSHTVESTASLVAIRNLDICDANQDSPDPYEYQSLPSLTSIRLLKVARKEKNGVMHVSLKTVELNDDPFFYALSYTWGNPHANGVDFTTYFDAVNEEYSASNKASILCDGKRLRIQKNLLDILGEFLEIFAEKSRGNDQTPEVAAGSPRASSTTNSELGNGIWVDAVCINQEDAEERASQVRLMDKVYAKAARTLIWLGRADKYTPAAAETIKRVAAYPREVFVQSEANPFRRQDPEVYAKSNLAYTGWMDWCSLAALLKRQWFSRLWIVQETILSRDLIVFCGEHEISWTELVAAARNIEARCYALGWNPGTMFLQSHEVAVPLEHNLLRLAEWRDHFHDKPSTPPETGRSTIENLVYDTWVFNSTDPRDKVYGILGLVDPELRAAWDINYKSSPEEVFAITTRTIIEQSRSLTILSCVQDASKRTIATYPSWVPDYSLPYFNMMCNNGSFAAAGAQYPTPQLLPSSSGSEPWSRLRLRAHIFDSVVETANDRTEYVNSAMLLEPSWFELALLLKTPYPATGQKRTEVLWRTLCADQDASSTVSPAPARFGPLFKELVCAMVVVRAEIEKEVSQEPNPPRDCAASFALAMQRAKEIWADVGWDQLAPEQIRDKTGSTPRFLCRPEFGWLAHTLIKLQAVALTEEGGTMADTPTWEELEQFHDNPSYVMRVKDGENRSLVQPKDAAFTNSFRRRYGKRKLFYTEKGYLGLGPASAAVGDIVCIIPGAAAPFLCREDPDGGVGLEGQAVEEDSGAKRLRLIGESYVHGIMHGEATQLKGFRLGEIEIV